MLVDPSILSLTYSFARQTLRLIRTREGDFLTWLAHYLLSRKHKEKALLPYWLARNARTDWNDSLIGLLAFLGQTLLKDSSLEDWTQSRTQRVTGPEGNMNTAKSRSRPLGRDGVSGQGKESKRSVLSWTLPGGLETEETSSHSRPM